MSPDGIAMGSGVTFYPSVELSIKDDSNVYLQSSGNEDSSVVTRLRPNASVVADLGATNLTGYAQVESGSYDLDSDDNYLDTLLMGSAAVELSSRQSLNFDAKLNMAHDPRGTGSTQGAAASSVTKPNEYDETDLNAAYTYGADSAFANVTGYVGSYGKEYSNNAASTDVLNHDKIKFGAKLGLKVSSATRVLFEARNTTISYSDSAAAAKEGSELKLLVGASYDVTGKTTAELLVGNSKREFDESTNSSDSRFSWEGKLTWNPVTYSTVSVTTAQSANETTAGGSYTANQTTTVNWNHQFSNYWSMNATAGLSKDDYVGIDRSDKNTNLGLTGIYSPTKNVDVKASLDKAKRSSTSDALDYDQHVIGVAVELAF
ncbi:outer membrane beta-barrel protein [Parathalassolituus penaei]|uniref:Outer membrane beta-barrel protein n=1 Tax=Parathalassolituus penaei TaxID=2997323 RepID=A0A9X3EG90_9GAMM|nr:outer membrane beta-barrel protein [Parathalassolituus penaei]MCY0966959.1 outer membrane beta-barrel protein [Parathalassolituus penaei]